MTLKEDLNARVIACRRTARSNYYAAYILLVIGVGASTAASIMAGTDSSARTLTAVLAAVPGILVLVTNTFKFAARAEWWWTKHHRIDALYRKLLYENASEPEVSQELTRVDTALENSWPGFGGPPAGGPG